MSMACLAQRAAGGAEREVMARKRLLALYRWPKIILKPHPALAICCHLIGGCLMAARDARIKAAPANNMLAAATKCERRFRAS